STGFGDRVVPASMDVFAAGAELLAALGATDGPSVLVVDDLQWADSQSAAALRFAVRRLLAEPLLVVLITRPHPEDALGEPWARLLFDAQRVTHVHLDGLTTDGIVDLVSAAGHGRVGTAMAERLREHTDGNPLHTRALVDEVGDAALRSRDVLPAPRSFVQLTL